MEKINVKKADGKLGVLVVGVGGAVASTFVVGTLAVRKGLAKPIGSINNIDLLERNLAMNCIPNDIFKMDFESYSRFLQERRTLMAQKIKDYYYSL